MIRFVISGLLALSLAACAPRDGRDGMDGLGIARGLKHTLDQQDRS